MRSSSQYCSSSKGFFGVWTAGRRYRQPLPNYSRFKLKLGPSSGECWVPMVHKGGGQYCVIFISNDYVLDWRSIRGRAAMRRSVRASCNWANWGGGQNFQAAFSIGKRFFLPPIFRQRRRDRYARIVKMQLQHALSVGTQQFHAVGAQSGLDFGVRMPEGVGKTA